MTKQTHKQTAAKGLSQWLDSLESQTMGIGDLAERQLKGWSEWLLLNGFPDDIARAVKIAVAELGEFMTTAEADDVPLDNVRELLQTCVDRRKWLANIHKPAVTLPDETPVSADQLGAFAGVGGKVVRVALQKAGRKPWIKSTGKGNPHLWRYCDAVQALRAVKSGKLRSFIWPDSAVEVMPQKDSSKIPVKKAGR